MSMNIDLKDKKILLALDMGARATDSSIARRVGLSKQVTNYRIKRLENKGIIKSYSAVIDHTKLGLKLYKVLIKLENLDKEQEKALFNYLGKHASWFASVLGNWDIAFAVYSDDEYAFMRFWREFYDIYGRFIESRVITLMTTFWNFERSFILPDIKDRQKTFVLGKDPVKRPIDDIDKKILRALTLDVRQTSLKIAGSIDETERVVRYRIKKLEESGIILGYRAFIDTSLLNMKFYKVFVNLKDAKKADIATIRMHMMDDPSVGYITEALGGPDFELEASFHGSKELFDFLTALKETFPKVIKSTEHMEYVKEHKMTYFPLAD